MIKKLLYVVIIIGSIWAFYGFFFKGQIAVNIGNFNFNYDVPSFQSIKDGKKTLDSNLSSLEDLNTRGMNNATAHVESELKNYETKKQEYDMLAASASREEIAEANKEEKFLLDYLWIRVGNYANDNAVKFKMTPNEADSTLTFDVTGSYISIINFIYDLQNDSILNFVIDGVYIEGASSSQAKANFNVENVSVITSPNEA